MMLRHVVVAAIAVALIGLINWYFFLAGRKDGHREVSHEHH
jgi:hypothetical protein